ncbi:MAG: VWA domain-containing protein [Spirochaetaceae bacterium]|jgi:hypothetical protein|nr:VWA domain-containing protein [Spirochaetaceae bacterium]
MNLKKIAAGGLLLLWGALVLSGQQQKDVILIVDTSVSMLPHYHEAGTYLTGPFLAENVHFSDTFHLISFGTKPRVEISRPVLGLGDIENVSSRIWLLYPLENTSNPEAALQFAEQYLRTLPAGRPKVVFFMSSKDAGGAVNAMADRFRSGGAELFSLKASGGIAAAPGKGSSGETLGAGPSGSPVSGENSGGGSSPGGRTAGPTVSAGGGTETGGRTEAAGGTVTGPGGAARPGEEPVPGGRAVSAGGPGTAGGTGSGGGIPIAAGNPGTGNSPGSQAAPYPEEAAVPGAEGGTGLTNPGGTDSPAGTENTGDAASGGIGPFIRSLSLPLLIAGGLFLLLVLALIIIVIARNLQSSPNKVIASAGSTDDTAAKNAELLNRFASQQAAASLKGPHRRYHHFRDDAAQILTNPPMLTIFVEEQNTAIGRRNVHALKKGNTYTVGGGNSDFLIFLVSIPPRIGRLYFDGNNCTFTPLRPKYFPDIGSTPVHECLGKTIRILSDKNYEIFFHFEQYKDPLIILNQLLHSISVPSAPPVPQE